MKFNTAIISAFFLNSSLASGPRLAQSSSAELQQQNPEEIHYQLLSQKEQQPLAKESPINPQAYQQTGKQYPTAVLYEQEAIKSPQQVQKEAIEAQNALLDKKQGRKLLVRKKSGRRAECDCSCEFSSCSSDEASSKRQFGQYRRKKASSVHVPLNEVILQQQDQQQEQQEQQKRDGDKRRGGRQKASEIAEAEQQPENEQQALFYQPDQQQLLREQYLGLERKSHRKAPRATIQDLQEAQQQKSIAMQKQQLAIQFVQMAQLIEQAHEQQISNLLAQAEEAGIKLLLPQSSEKTQAVVHENEALKRHHQALEHELAQLQELVERYHEADLAELHALETARHHSLIEGAGKGRAGSVASGNRLGGPSASYAFTPFVLAPDEALKSQAKYAKDLAASNKTIYSAQ